MKPNWGVQPFNGSWTDTLLLQSLNATWQATPRTDCANIKGI
jgi:hypothetical protein